MLRLAYNATDSSVLVDESGYQIGGRSWGPVDTLDPIAQAEFAALRIVEADEDAVAASDRPDAVAAVQALKDRRDRRAAAEAMSKADLLTAVDPDVVAGLPEGGDGVPAKADLVEAVEDQATVLPEAPEAPETTPTVPVTTTKSRTTAKTKETQA